MPVVKIILDGRLRLAVNNILTNNLVNERKQGGKKTCRTYELTAPLQPRVKYYHDISFLLIRSMMLLL